MKLALAQLNPTVGDLTGNRKLAEAACTRAARAGAKLVALPELAICGYPPMDLLESAGFVEAQMREVQTLAAHASREGVAVAVGAALPVAARGGKRLANAALLLQGGEVQFAQHKTLLPTYDVFDEKRYFAPAQNCAPCTVEGLAVGLCVCEDAWVDALDYPRDAIAEQVQAGAQLLLNLSASPWHLGKSAERRELFGALAAKHGRPMLCVNQVGGNDELIFDGGSFALDARGQLRAQAPLFESAMLVISTEELGAENSAAAAAPLNPAAAAAAEGAQGTAQLARALTLGIRDYFAKLGGPKGAVVGLSGGIDSAVTAWLAVQALGAQNVLGCAMPGPFSSAHSLEDARALAHNLGIKFHSVDIRGVYESYRELFAQLFGAQDEYGLAQQNIQARIRGATLMAIANAQNRLVLATGNKSELSVGYCTLYGDTVGGLAVLGDCYKHQVYALARAANAARAAIPQNTITKAPSAELAPGQLDSDDLPEYDALDSVLKQAIEGGLPADAISPPPGMARAEAAAIVQRLARNEYKRRQAPPVLRVSPKAFGSGRRLPIAHQYWPE